MVNLLAEEIKDLERFSSKPSISKEYIKNAMDFILKKIDANLKNNFLYKFPSSASINNIYEATDNTEWTPGFWTGMLWLAYEVTLDDKYREAAELQLKSYEDRLKDNLETQTHDLGFLYTLSCVAAYKLTGNINAKNIALQASDKLVERYLPKARIIQA